LVSLLSQSPAPPPAPDCPLPPSGHSPCGLLQGQFGLARYFVLLESSMPFLSSTRISLLFSRCVCEIIRIFPSGLPRRFLRALGVLFSSTFLPFAPGSTPFDALVMVILFFVSRQFRFLIRCLLLSWLTRQHRSYSSP